MTVITRFYWRLSILTGFLEAMDSLYGMFWGPLLYKDILGPSTGLAVDRVLWALNNLFWICGGPWLCLRDILGLNSLCGIIEGPRLFDFGRLNSLYRIFGMHYLQDIWGPFKVFKGYLGPVTVFTDGFGRFAAL
jgi:hypothetical protein